MSLRWTLPILVALISGCASPVDGLWPPREGEASYRILVSVDSWHSVIGLWPKDDPRGAKMADIDEWGFVERDYYLDGDSGSSGTMRAMLVLSDGVVVRAREGEPWSERTYDPPARAWSFEISEEGHRRLREHLEAERLSEEPFRTGASTFFASTASYHALHHCHHFTARALREAGLPIWSAYSLFKWSLEAQLDRAAEMQSLQGSPEHGD
jgi:hypothetical protein